MNKQTLIAIGLMAVTGTAFAGLTDTSPGAAADTAFGQSFAAVDKNGDGMISWSEANAKGISKTAFQSAETTQDGMLSKTEYQVAQSAREGVVGEAVEIGEDTSAKSESAFSAMDANKDNRVSKQEFQNYFQASGLFDRWDVDDDGRVDRNEFVQVLYIYYDDNNDGYIDDAEWEDGLMVDDYGDNGLWDT